MTWDLSSAGRASALQAEGHRFKSCRSHLFFINIKYGGIAQLARARGSYPRCRWFKSNSRYFLLRFFVYVIDRRKRNTPYNYRCDFSRCVLNIRLNAHIQHLLRGHIYNYMGYFVFCLWLYEKQKLQWGGLENKFLDFQTYTW